MGRKIYDEDIRLNLILNGEQLNAGSKKMVAELGKLEREMVNLEQAAKATAAKIKLLEQNTAANAVQLAAERQNLHNTTIAMQAKSKAIEDMRKQIGLAGMTVSQLNNHLKALRLQLNNTAGDVEMQRRLRQEIMETEIMLRTRLTGASRLAQAWERVERAVNRAGTIVGWFAIALFGISRLVGGVISRMKDLEDLMGSVRKNTGLTAAEVWDMKEAFDQMDTRTKTDDLLKLSVVAGKLGINGKEDIQRFVEAANMIQVALGDDLNGSVEDTVTNIAKLMNSFRVDKEMSIDKAMLKTGSVLNELAKSSAASAETILNYMTRLSAVGELAGFTPAQIGGIASTLDAMNVPAERGATAIQKIMLAMANPKRISDFAEALKLNSDEYKELLKNNPNYVLTQLLTKFVANKDGLIDLTAGMKDFGAKGQYMTEVVGALAQNLDVMTEQQKIAEKAWKDGTSVVDEYNIMNSNFTSEVLKQQKIIRAQTDQINKDAEPAVLNIVKAWTKFVVATKDTVYWIGAHWQAIKNLTAVYIALRFPAIWRIGSIIAETAVEKAGLAIKQLKIFWMKTEIFWIVITTRSTQALTIEQLRMIGTSTLLTFATTLMTQGFKAAWVELVALRTATGAMAFPIAGAIIAITAITVAIGYLVFKKKELTESEKRQLELQKSIQADFFKEKANLTVLIDQLKDVNISQTARKRLIGEINEQYGEYLPKLLTEKTTTEELTGAYNLLIEALARKISTQKLTESGADILNRIDLNKEEIDAQTKSLEAFKERHKAELEIAKYNPRAYGVELSSMFQMEKNLKDLKNKGVELQNEYGTILNKLSNLTPKKGFNIKGGGLTSTEDDTETFKNRQAERESNFKKEEVQIKEQYANKVGMQDELNEKLRKSNLNFVNESIADYEKANRTEGENAAAYWALREKRADLMLSSEKGTTKAIKEENKERIKDAKEFEQELIDIEKLRIETITNEREKSIATENERHLQSMAKNWKNDQALEYEEVIHQQNLTEINQKFLDKQLADKTLNYTQKEVLLEEYWKQELITEETYWILKSQLNKDKQLALEEFKKQYGLLSMQQTIDMEIAELKRGAFYYLLTEEEKERAIDSIRLKYGRKRAQTLKRNIDKELNDIKEKFTEEQQLAYENGTKQITIYENMGDRITNVFSEMFAENQNAMAVFGKEMLLIALDFIKAEIRLQYPLILAKQIASKGVIAGPIAAGTSIALIEAAMAVGFGLAKGLIGSINTSKKTKQAADGIYPVIGGNDGQLYNAYYGGQAQTGIYGKPTLLEMSGGRTLVGERAPELVVDGNTFRRMQINAPGLLNDIYAFAGKGSGSASRLERQMAEGNYPLNRSMEGAITIGSDPELKAINRALAEELKYLRENGIKAKVAGYGGEGSVADAIQKIAALAKSLKL